jgi:hypothetical protein
VSTYRDSLDPVAAPAYDEAIAAAAKVLKLMQAEQAELAATEGPEAVARESWPVRCGLAAAGEIEARYRQLQDQARKANAA